MPNKVQQSTLQRFQHHPPLEVHKHLLKFTFDIFSNKINSTGATAAYDCVRMFTCIQYYKCARSIHMPVFVRVCIGIEYVTAVVLKYIAGSVCTGVLQPLR